MPRVVRYALQFIDPRGRCDRKAFLSAAAVLLAAQALVAAGLWIGGAPFDGGLALALNAAFCWLGYAAISKRLHDLGRSAWWVPGGALVWAAGALVAAIALVLAAGPAALEPGASTYWLALTAMQLPLLGAAPWLHFAAGEQGDNPFGPAPSQGFSTPSHG
jgi:uncharacterized membrane protein YhaH (DUF805 family)